MENSKQFLHDILGMQFFTAGDGTICGKMDVTEKVCQPFGFLSGGASLALAETLAGYASLALCEKNQIPNGIQVSANHLNPAPLGDTITAKASLLKQGKNLHVWNIEINNQDGKPISSCHVTNYIKTLNNEKTNQGYINHKTTTQKK